MSLHRRSAIARLFVLVPAFALLACAETRAGLVSFGDIPLDHWYGSGANQAALVVDWNDGKDSLLFGYRFDGVKTGEDLLRAVAAGDQNFFLRLGTPGAFGTPLYGIGYDRAEPPGFAVSDGTETLTEADFPNGVHESGVPDEFDPAATPVDPADSYREGWFTGFWGYYNADGKTAIQESDWQDSFVGVSGRTLGNNSWDGLSFAPGFNFTSPTLSAPAAAPEPSSMLLLGGCLAAAGVAGRFRSRRRAE